MCMTAAPIPTVQIGRPLLQTALAVFGAPVPLTTTMPPNTVSKDIVKFS